MHTPILTLMTAQQVAETYTRLEKIGSDGSTIRKMAQDLQILAGLAKEADIQNQEFYHMTSNLEQFLFKLRMYRDTYKRDNAQVESGIDWLKKQDVIEQSFYMPDVNKLEQRAKDAIDDRARRQKEAKTNEATKGQKNGRKGFDE